MPKVVIDGVEYVPKAATPVEISNEAADRALGHLVFAAHIHYGSSRGLWNSVWDALRELQPGIDGMDERELAAMYDARWGEGSG